MIAALRFHNGECRLAVKSGTHPSELLSRCFVLILHNPYQKNSRLDCLGPLCTFRSHAFRPLLCLACVGHRRPPLVWFAIDRGCTSAHPSTLNLTFQNNHGRVAVANVVRHRGFANLGQRCEEWTERCVLIATPHARVLVRRLATC